MVDTFSRLSPVIDPRFSYRGEDVVATLEQACREIGYPKTIRVDNGSEFISRDMDLWAYQRGVTLDFSRPGKPTDNAFIEAFNSKLRSECLNAHWFLSLEDACEKLEAWRRHYNEERPHSAIGNIPPIMLANSAGETSPPDLSKAENSSREWSSFQVAEHYNWKAKYGGMEVSEAKRLRSLEDENAKLKRLLADTMLDNAALKDLLSKNW